VSEKTFKALLLDERDVFVQLVELEDDAQLTARHVDLRAHGRDCDRPTGEYRWDRDKQCLEPLPRQQRAQRGKPTLEQSVAFDLLKRWEAAPAAVSDVALAWLDDVLGTHDFKGFVIGGHPLITAYAEARGLDLKKKD
jgi:hypothetical protein